MIIKSEGYYRTRCGKRAYVVGQSPETQISFAGYVQSNSEWLLTTWLGNGSCKGRPEWDLIASWDKPHVVSAGAKKIVQVGMDSIAVDILDVENLIRDLKKEMGE